MDRSANARSFATAEPLDLNAARATRETAATIVLPVPAAAPEPPQAHPSLGRPRVTWVYRDAAGGVIGYVARFDPAGERKQFSPLTLWSENGRLRWRWKGWPKPRPLYGLDRLAARPNASVIVAEGEKAADAAQTVFPNSVVMTSSGGAEAAGSADWRPLAGRAVMIWPDNDAPGRKYALQVEAELAAIGAGTVTIADAQAIAAAAPSGDAREPQEGWDAADGLEEGWDPVRLKEIVLANVERAEPPPTYVSFGHYAMNSDGLVVEVTKGRGETASVEEVWCSAPFEVIGRARDPQGHGWARWLRWRDPDGNRSASHDPRRQCLGSICGRS